LVSAKAREGQHRRSATYREKHKDEILERNAKYRETNRVEIRVKERQWYHDRASQVKAAGKRYRQRLKEQIIKHYSKGTSQCARCGINDIDVLCIDHINGNGNEHRRSIGITSGYSFYQWLNQDGLPLGFQVLCYNCNMKKRITDYAQIESKKKSQETSIKEDEIGA